MSEKLSEYCRRQASRPCPEDYGFNVEWNLAADDALALEAERDGLKAKLEALGRAIQGGSRLKLRSNFTADYDGAYDWIEKPSHNDPDNQVGHHPADWPGDGYMVVRLVNEEALAAAQEEQE